MVVATGVGCRALNAVQFADDLVFVGRQGFGDRRKVGFQVRVLVLRRQGLSPIERDVEVAATVVEAADA